MADTDLDSIAQRLDRIERAVSQLTALGSLGPLGPTVDPPPDDLVRLRPDIFQRRLIDLIREIIVKGDPPPFDFSRFRGGAGGAEARWSDLLRRGPGSVVDPPPDDLLNVRLGDLLRRWRGGVADPVPEDLVNVRLRDLLEKIAGGRGGVADPVPDDIGRLSREQVEAQIHQVNAEMVRLKSLDQMLNERLAQLKD